MTNFKIDNDTIVEFDLTDIWSIEQFESGLSLNVKCFACRNKAVVYIVFNPQFSDYYGVDNLQLCNNHFVETMTDLMNAKDWKGFQFDLKHNAVRDYKIMEEM